jgi:alkylation response protein AidB-like acyl-CoA dehydrogenase
VTGADSSDSIVTGAVAADGTPRFFIIPTSAAGLTISAPMPMLALSGSRTSSVAFDGVEPSAEIVSSSAAPARAGGLATSALAIGSTRASIALIAHEAAARPALEPVATSFRHEADELTARLGWLAGEEIPDPSARDALRTAANSLVVRAAQAALVEQAHAAVVQFLLAEAVLQRTRHFLLQRAFHLGLVLRREDGRRLPA